MNEKLSISSWNINKALSTHSPEDAARRQRVYEYVANHPSDLHVFIEAYGGADETLPGDVRAHFEEMGYVVGDCPHHDSARETANPSVQKGIVYLSRIAGLSSEVVNFDGARDLPLLSFERKNGEMSYILVVHLDDRTEYARWVQTRRIIDDFRDRSNNLIIVGDFNSMPKNSKIAQTLRTADFMHLAMTERDGRTASLLQRSAQMAIGGAYHTLTKELNLTDADPDCSPTITLRQKGFTPPASVIDILQKSGIDSTKGIFKLDHFLAGSDYGVEAFEAEDVFGDVSDHLAIRALYRMNAV